MANGRLLHNLGRSRLASFLLILEVFQLLLLLLQEFLVAHDEDHLSNKLILLSTLFAVG